MSLVKQFLIYKGNSIEELALYSSSDSYEFIDKKIKINNTYYYVIKVVFLSGLESNMSKVIEVFY